MFLTGITGRLKI